MGARTHAPGQAWPWLAEPARLVGKSAEALTRHVGGLWLLVCHVARAFAGRRVSWRSVVQQAYSMGAQSVPLVLVTGALSGVVTSQQGGYQFTGAVPRWVLGTVVASSIILEIGPVMTALVLVGRVGARITAEIGTMRVSEQIDALHVLGRDPVAVLAAPRLLAGVLVTPLLVAIADLVGVLSGMVAARAAVDLAPEQFLYGMRVYWHDFDLFYSLAKGAAFGFVIPLISAHLGLLTEGGAEGVGRATTASVVAAIVAVLAIDAVFPQLLLLR